MNNGATSVTGGPRVSVLMSVLEPDLGFLRDALESLRRQTLQDFELVLLEDPSEVSAEELVSEFGDPRFRYLRTGARTSLAESRIRAAELAHSDLVAILDADDIAAPERLQRQVEFLERHAEVDVLGSAIEAIRPDGSSAGIRRYPTTHAAIVAAMPRYNPLAHPSVVMRKEQLSRVGGYSLSSRASAVEDYELWSRMASRGKVFANLPDVLVRYRLHAGSTKATRLKETLRGTLWVKRTYWQERQGVRGRLRLLGEMGLRWLPARLVHRLFERIEFRRARSG